MSNSDNTKYWSCNDMMIILLQYDDHHLQFANCCFNHFLTKLADCSTRTFVCNFCKSLRIISLYVLQPFFWIILYQIFTLLFQIIFWIFFNCHFTSFLFSFLQKLQIVVPNQFLCQICNPGQAIPKLLIVTQKCPCLFSFHHKDQSEQSASSTEISETGGRHCESSSCVCGWVDG